MERLLVYVVQSRSPWVSVPWPLVQTGPSWRQLVLLCRIPVYSVVLLCTSLSFCSNRSFCSSQPALLWLNHVSKLVALLFFSMLSIRPFGYGFFFSFLLLFILYCSC